MLRDNRFKADDLEVKMRNERTKCGLRNCQPQRRPLVEAFHLNFDRRYPCQMINLADSKHYRPYCFIYKAHAINGERRLRFSEEAVNILGRSRFSGPI